MPIPSIEFYMGFSCCVLVVLMYLLNELVKILREILEIVKKEFWDD